mmetsp:Transcript_24298/g.55307  ORF Transcript_24298/g.55307 Transcript_24298/m.55307 type:complete len:203 (+) Transcript_24298:1002-1610(+)
MSIELSESPVMLLLFFQNVMSFLKARKSNSMCKTETKAVSPRRSGDVSVNIRFNSSEVSWPCNPACASIDACICAVSIHRIIVVMEKVSSRGNSSSVWLTTTNCSDINQNSLTKSTGKYVLLSWNNRRDGWICGGMAPSGNKVWSSTAWIVNDGFQCGTNSAAAMLFCASAWITLKASLYSPEIKFLVAFTFFALIYLTRGW